MKQFKKIYIEITNFCNLNCTFCAKSTRNKAFMTLEQFESIVAQVKDYTDYIYLHVLGEPLLHPQLDGILKLASNYNLKVNITTNGTLLLEKLDILLANKIRQFNISLHCENNGSNDSYFNSVLNAADKLSNKSYINYRSWVEDNKNIKKHILNHYNVEINEKNRQKIAKNIFFSIEKPFEWEGTESDTNLSCYGGKTMCAILCDGTVTACCIDYDGKINFGNIFTTPFSEIINSKKFTTFTNLLSQKKSPCGVCSSCQYKKRFM